METYGAWIKEQGKARKMAVADLFRPLTDATNDRRRTEQDYTFFPDAMHPTPPGHATSLPTQRATSAWEIGRSMP